jgi:ubiquinone/menaquinone biosynthesis C-methylase UbiE
MIGRERQTVGDLYEDAHLAWSGAAELVYRPMADALVAHCPVDLAGRLVLDVGAGTGAGSRALEAVGAEPIAIDLAFSMLAHDRAHRPPALVADLYQPPIRAASVSGVLAPFVLNHVDAPADALTALAGCIEHDGVVLASTFSEDDRPPVKDVIDAVALRHGCEMPAAYRFVREAAAPLIGSSTAMAEVASAAGLVDIEVVAESVDTGVSAPKDLVAYRFALPHVAAFLAAQPPHERAAIVAEAVDEVARRHDGAALAPMVVFLSSRVP